MNFTNYAYYSESHNLKDYIVNVPKFSQGSFPLGTAISASWVIGNSGIGKTIFVKNLISELNFPNQVINLRQYFNNFELDDLETGSFDKIWNNLLVHLDQIHFNEDPQSVYILVFDHLEIFCKDKQFDNDNIETFKQHILKHIHHVLFKYQYIYLLFLTTDFDKLPNEFKNLTFSKVQLNSPDIHQRKLIIRSMLNELNVTITLDNLNLLAQRTNGYIASDLSKILKIAMLYQFGEKSSLLEDNDLDQMITQMENMQLNNDIKYHEPKVELDGPGLEYGITNVIPSQQIGFETYFPDQSFDNIGGYGFIKSSLSRIFQLIQSSFQGIKPMGLEPPTGILFHGPPGCGKTSIALAFANECKMNVIRVKGPQMFSKYFGETEALFRSLFQTARKMSPCIIFLDELDSIASKRGFSGDSATSTINNNVLTTLLNEMDGVEKGNYVLVLACTNQLSFIDDALLRPGRFDITFEVGLPDYEDRYEIFTKLNPNLKPTEVHLLSNETQGFSPAKIKRLISEAGLYGLRNNSNLTSIDFDQIYYILKNNHFC